MALKTKAVRVLPPQNVVEIGIELIPDAQKSADTEAGTDAAPVEVKKVEHKLNPDLVPGTIGPKGYVPKGHVELVDCDVTPLPLKIGFNTSIAYRILRDNYQGPGNTPVERECRRILLIAPVFEGWNVVDPLDGTEVPPPDPTDWETYRPIVSASGLMGELYPWILGEGLTKALRQSAGN